MPVNKRQLLIEAKERNPNLTRDQAREILEKADLAEEPPELSKFQSFAKGVSDVAPTLGGIAGGIAGTAVGSPSGPGMIAAGAAGTAAGVGTGTALGESLENLAGIQEETPQELAIEAIVDPAIAGAIDAATLGMFAAGEKALGLLKVSPVGKALGWAGKSITKRAQKLYSKASPTAWRKAVEEHGVDLNNLVKKYISPGSTLDDFLGPVEERNYGGKFRTMMQQQEKRIGKALEASGDKVVATADDLVKPLQQRLDKLDSLPGNADIVRDLGVLIEETKLMFKNGLSAEQLLSVKRAADDDFGKRVVEETAGSVTAQSQKIIANVSRKILKDYFPGIKGALDTESDLYVLKGVLGHARAIRNTPGSELRIGKPHLLRPNTWLDPLLNVEKVGSTLSRGLPTAPEALSNIGAGARNVIRGVGQVARGAFEEPGGGGGQYKMPEKYTYK